MANQRAMPAAIKSRDGNRMAAYAESRGCWRREGGNHIVVGRDGYQTAIPRGPVKGDGTFRAIVRMFGRMGILGLIGAAAAQLGGVDLVGAVIHAAGLG